MSKFKTLEKFLNNIYLKCSNFFIYYLEHGVELNVLSYVYIG